tara:strand:+ start:3414 stop:3767 length:354 start_codon:yes stop_codon:yes gene_type:complete
MKLRSPQNYAGDRKTFPPSGHITPEKLHDFFYVGDRKDGEGKELFWKVSRGRKVRADDPAGTIHLPVNKVSIAANPLDCNEVAYILQTGKFPQGKIIHLDGDTANHDIKNLFVTKSR